MIWVYPRKRGTLHPIISTTPSPSSEKCNFQLEFRKMIWQDSRRNSSHCSAAVVVIRHRGQVIVSSYVAVFHTMKLLIEHLTLIKHYFHDQWRMTNWGWFAMCFLFNWSPHDSILFITWFYCTNQNYHFNCFGWKFQSVIVGWIRVREWLCTLGIISRVSIVPLLYYFF